jgi:hypothetical protein
MDGRHKGGHDERELDRNVPIHFDEGVASRFRNHRSRIASDCINDFFTRASSRRNSVKV